MPDHTEADCRRLRALGALNRMSLPPATTKRKAHRAFRGGKAKKDRRKGGSRLQQHCSPQPGPPLPSWPPVSPLPPLPPGLSRSSYLPPRASPPSNEAQASGVVGRAPTPATTTIVDGEKKNNEKKNNEKKNNEKKNNEKKNETLKDYIEDALTEHSPENAPIIARMEYEMSLGFPPERDPYIQAKDVEDMIGSHIRAGRYGPHEWFTLGDILDNEQKCWEPHQRENDPLTYEGVEDPKPWQVVNHNRYTSRPLKPHSIMSCLAQLWPDASQGLSTHELRAIVNTMLLRVNHNPFRKCHIHPILVLSFMGDYQGRIIQASYDGKGLILQYSQLWSFADIKKAPVELFVRYRLSQTVGGIRTLS
ncbi:hypothetical protein E8E15_010978 [Penicillium rubens]|nr:hypothetical protein E8E15_010978 [Penicillium rubens]